MKPSFVLFLCILLSALECLAQSPYPSNILLTVAGHDGFLREACSFNDTARFRTHKVSHLTRIYSKYWREGTNIPTLEELKKPTAKLYVGGGRIKSTTFEPWLFAFDEMGRITFSGHFSLSYNNQYWQDTSWNESQFDRNHFFYVDKKHRIEKRVYNRDGVPASRKVFYQFNEEGNLEKEVTCRLTADTTYQFYKTVDYTYNKRGQPTKISERHQGEDKKYDYALNISYQPDSNKTTVVRREKSSITTEQCYYNNSGQVSKHIWERHSSQPKPDKNLMQCQTFVLSYNPEGQLIREDGTYIKYLSPKASPKQHKSQIYYVYNKHGLLQRRIVDNKSSDHIMIADFMYFDRKGKVLD